MTKEAPLVLIVRQLKQARRTLARERHLIARLKAKGRPSTQLEKMLTVFDNAIDAMERQAAQLSERPASQLSAAARRPAAKLLH